MRATNAKLYPIIIISITIITFTIIIIYEQTFQSRRSSCISRLPSAAPVLPVSPASIIEEKWDFEFLRKYFAIIRSFFCNYIERDLSPGFCNYKERDLSPRSSDLDIWLLFQTGEWEQLRVIGGLRREIRGLEKCLRRIRSWWNVQEGPGKGSRKFGGIFRKK